MEEMLRRVRVMEDHRGYKVGWPADATYQDGQVVAKVALANEFGVTDEFGDQVVPERPFFRLANLEFKSKAGSLLTQLIRASDGVVDRKATRRMGMFHVNLVQNSIRDLKEPPNAPSTIARKGGKSNPLIDTGLMRRSVNYELLT